MELMEQHTAKPAVDASREEHGADLAGFDGVSQQRRSRPGAPHFPRSHHSQGHTFPSQPLNGLNSQMAPFFTSLFQWITG
jgi:hypothetical protein